MPPKEGKPLTEKQQKAKEKKERKLLEQQIKQSKEKFDEGRAFLEPEGKAPPVYPKAIAAFDAAIELYPENADAFTFRGHAYRDQGMFDNAIEDYSKAFSLNAQCVPALEGRATCYESLGHWDKAANDYTTILSIQPENDHAYNMRGVARLHRRAPGLLLKNADFAAVVEDFTAAIRLNENNYFAFCNLGKAYVDQRMYRKAIEAFTKALDVKEDYSYATFRRGSAALLLVEALQNEVQAKVDAKAKAEASISATATKEEVDRVAQLIISSQEAEEKAAKEVKQLLQQAIADFTKIIPEEKQNELTAIVHRGSCHALLGDLNAAEEDFAFALKHVDVDKAMMRTAVEKKLASVRAAKESRK